jgi:hypothetical protein
MKPTRNHSTHNSQTSKSAQYGPTLARAAATLASFLIAGLLSSSAHAQADAAQVTLNHPGWVQVPGELIRPDCVHELPKGANVEIKDGQITGDVTLNGQFLTHYDPCPEEAISTRHEGPSEELASTPSSGNGWVEASLWNTALKSGDNIDFMSGNLTVPSKPSKNGALIYLFNGVETSGENWIVQPTLQYGNNGSFGGNYWTIASWMVGPNYVFNSPGETVYAGDSLYLYSEIYSESGGLQYWRVEATDNTTGAYSYITDTSSGLQWTWAISGALEGYTITSCSDFPANGKAVFTGSTVDHGFPSYNKITPTGWFGTIYSYGGPSCGFKVTAGIKSTLNF